MDKYNLKRLTSKEDLVNVFDSILSPFLIGFLPLTKFGLCVESRRHDQRTHLSGPAACYRYIAIFFPDLLREPPSALFFYAFILALTGKRMIDPLVGEAPKDPDLCSNFPD